jgi:hypothetical protein
LTESGVWEKASGRVVRPRLAVVIAPSERKSRLVVMAGMVTLQAIGNRE